MKKRRPIFPRVESELVYIVESVWNFLKKLKIEISYNLVVQLVSI